MHHIVTQRNLFIFQNAKKMWKSVCRNNSKLKFRTRLNNYKSAHKSFQTKKRETQKLFQGHYIQDDNEGKDNLRFKLINQCTANVEFRKRGLYWQHYLKNVFPDGLNELKNLGKAKVFVFYYCSSEFICFNILLSLFLFLFLLFELPLSLFFYLFLL